MSYINNIKDKFLHIKYQKFLEIMNIDKSSIEPILRFYSE